jgi:ATP sulfurylase
MTAIFSTVNFVHFAHEQVNKVHLKKNSVHFVEGQVNKVHLKILRVFRRGYLP